MAEAAEGGNGSTANMARRLHTKKPRNYCEDIAEKTPSCADHSMLSPLLCCKKETGRPSKGAPRDSEAITSNNHRASGDGYFLCQTQARWRSSADNTRRSGLKASLPPPRTNLLVLFLSPCGFLLPLLCC